MDISELIVDEGYRPEERKAADEVINKAKQIENKYGDKLKSKSSDFHNRLNTARIAKLGRAAADNDVTTINKINKHFNDEVHKARQTNPAAASAYKHIAMHTKEGKSAVKSSNRLARISTKSQEHARKELEHKVIQDYYEKNGKKLPNTKKVANESAIMDIEFK